jgi:mono/diheme cytochrome c family protein
MANVLIMIVLAALVVLLVVLALRAARARRAWVKWPGMLLSGLLALVLLVVLGTALLGFYRLTNAPHRYSVAEVQVAQTPEKVARGERLANICVDCHSSTMALPLDGSAEDFFADPSAPPIGTLWAPNLTPGGDLKNWTDGEIIRAMREGVDNKGRPLVIMPSLAMHNMSDEDAQALVAYLRSQPAVDRQQPEPNFTVLGAIFVGAGMLPLSPQTPITEPIVAPAVNTPEYGKYMVYAVGCADCHGPKLDGQDALMEGAPNLAASLSAWTEDEFIQFFRTGKVRGGRVVDNSNMPWKAYNNALTDDELSDMFSFLHNMSRAEGAEK